MIKPLLIAAVMSVPVLAACSSEIDNSIEKTKSRVFLAGESCGDTGHEINECAYVCDKMGTMKVECWNGYFEAVQRTNDTWTFAPSLKDDVAGQDVLGD